MKYKERLTQLLVRKLTEHGRKLKDLRGDWDEETSLAVAELSRLSALTDIQMLKDYLKDFGFTYNKIADARKTADKVNRNQIKKAA